MDHAYQRGLRGLDPGIDLPRPPALGRDHAPARLLRQRDGFIRAPAIDRDDFIGSGIERGEMRGKGRKRSSLVEHRHYDGDASTTHASRSGQASRSSPVSISVSSGSRCGLMPLASSRRMVSGKTCGVLHAMSVNRSGQGSLRASSQ